MEIVTLYVHCPDNNLKRSYAKEVRKLIRKHEIVFMILYFLVFSNFKNTVIIPTLAGIQREKPVEKSGRASVSGIRE